VLANCALGAGAILWSAARADRGPSRMTHTARSRSVPSGFRFSGRSHRRVPFSGRDIVPSFPRSGERGVVFARRALNNVSA
jgi:hypothetical protein